ncbi:HNH endonuclease [Streptosporangium sp. NPDC023615]|uniref:HNH endonuclease n=1 Tax=Streptosporangium sp. NPDC023615 TaxID=3154794 RepID=UPI003436D079
MERCMYCGDSLGTAIDHFEPITLAPLRAFDWLNHFLACDHCDSNAKRADYPCDPVSGERLLIDPSVEDPYDHLRLILRTGRYRARTPKGEATIITFRLNRWQLERARRDAFERCEDMLRGYARLLAGGEHQRASGRAGALLRQPHADVLYAMVRTLDSPGVSAVLDDDIIEILRTRFTVFGSRRETSHRTQASSVPERSHYST